jgi:caffeoyl-CoA O-methyltransferase
MTMQLLPRVIDEYAERHTTPESPALAALNRETHLKTELPIMLSGHLQGALLQMFSSMIRPTTILEIGTFTGYSAICLAHGLRDGGVLHTIDINEELQDLWMKYFSASGVQDKIVHHIGHAAQLIPTLNFSFDLVFIDADKVNYSLYYDLVFEKVPVGGFILADNVLYEGEVTLPESEQSKNARAMHAFNEKVKSDSRVQHVLMPVRDGIMIIKKVKS